MSVLVVRYATCATRCKPACCIKSVIIMRCGEQRWEGGREDMQLAGTCSLRTKEMRDILASWSQDEKLFTGSQRMELLHSINVS